MPPGDKILYVPDGGEQKKLILEIFIHKKCLPLMFCFFSGGEFRREEQKLFSSSSTLLLKTFLSLFFS